MTSLWCRMKDVWGGTGGNGITKWFLICTAENYCYDDQTTKNAIGGVHGTYGGQKSLYEEFSWEHLEERDNF